MSRHRKAGPAKTRKRPRTGVFLLVTAVLVAGAAGAGGAAYVARAHAGGGDPAALVVAGIPASRNSGRTLNEHGKMRGQRSSCE